MSLIPFEPLTDKFLLGLPLNLVALGQGLSGLTVTANSEALGAEASPHLLIDNHSTAYRSGPLISNVVIDWDLGTAGALMDTFILGGTNLQVADGWRFRAYDDVAGSGNVLYDSGVGRDCVVREDSGVLSEHAEELLRNRLSHCPIRMPTPIAPRGLRAVFFTAGGNGPDDFLEISLAYAGLALDVEDCLSQNSITFKRLSPTTQSLGGGGTSTPRVPLRKNNIPLSYLESAGTASVTSWLGTSKQHFKAFLWSTPQDLSTFDASGYFGVQSVGATGVERIGPRSTKSANIEIAEER